MRQVLFRLRRLPANGHNGIPLLGPARALCMFGAYKRAAVVADAPRGVRTCYHLGAVFFLTVTTPIAGREARACHCSEVRRPPQRAAKGPQLKLAARNSFLDRFPRRLLCCFVLGAVAVTRLLFHFPASPRFFRFLFFIRSQSQLGRIRAASARRRLPFPLWEMTTATMNNSV